MWSNIYLNCDVILNTEVIVTVYRITARQSIYISWSKIQKCIFSVCNVVLEKFYNDTINIELQNIKIVYKIISTQILNKNPK